MRKVPVSLSYSRPVNWNRSAVDPETVWPHTYTFDAYGRLATVNGSQMYVYDGEDRRTAKISPSTMAYVYFGSQPIATVIGSSWMDYIYSGSELLAEVAGKETGVPTHRVLDNLGSLGGSLSSTGSFSGEMNYIPDAPARRSSNCPPVHEPK